MYSCVLQQHKQTLTLLALCVPLFWGFLFWFITCKDSRIDKNTRVLFQFFTPLPSSRLGFSPLFLLNLLIFLGILMLLSEMMKRDSVSAGFDQSLGFDNGAVAKLKYQTLVGEFLELQKDFLSRKRKLHAVKQKRDTILSEVRFLRRRRNDLLQNQSFQHGRRSYPSFKSIHKIQNIEGGNKF